MTNLMSPLPQPGYPPDGLDPRRVRTSLAVREYVRGNFTLSEASALVGVDSPEFTEFLLQLEALEASEEIGRPKISIVVPVYNEEANLPVLYDRLCRALAGAGSFEIVFVDDGSHDGSVAIISGLQRTDARVRLVRFSRNFGHQAALSAGLDHARGDIVILMDADLQDPPELAFPSFWPSGKPATRSSTPFAKSVMKAYSSGVPPACSTGRCGGCRTSTFPSTPATSA